MDSYLKNEFLEPRSYSVFFSVSHTCLPSFPCQRWKSSPVEAPRGVRGCWDKT